MNDKLELRMYGLVPYNLSPIQQGIQYGHAVQEYNNNIFELAKDYYNGSLDTPSKQEMWKFEQWRREDKTFIILNGGTTNINVNRLGTLNSHKQVLKENGIFFADFHEPDLGDQLTAVVFLVDERVFNREKYPDFFDYVKWKIRGYDSSKYTSFNQYVKSLIEERGSIYMDWVASIGGEKNEFLREFLRNFKLA